MEPIQEREIKRILKNNPQATSEMIFEYQTLLAERFALGPESRLRDKKLRIRAEMLKKKIQELETQIFPGSKL